MIVTKPTGLPEEHPRVCGENVVIASDRRAALGTSPRMRGKLLLRRYHQIEWRNIPAYAGKTMSPRPHQSGLAEHPRVCGETLHSSSAIALSSEHPRVCGENLVSVKTPGYGIGTSPRMRGKLFLRLRFTLLERNIPAYAGKTAFCCTTESKLSEHPRVCGENSPTLRPRCGWIGTSPRMRGKRMWRLDSLLGPRNIPAYAGKTTAGISPSTSK